MAPGWPILLKSQQGNPRRIIMLSNSTSTGQTSPSLSHPSCGDVRPTRLREVEALEFDWPGRDRFAVVVARVREQFSTLEEWWTVRRSGSGELGISSPPVFRSQGSDSVGFAQSWRLLA
jgi:hypothetical protein